MLQLVGAVDASVCAARLDLYDAGKTVSVKYMRLQVTQRRHHPLHLLLNCVQHISSCWSRCCQQAQVTHCYILPGFALRPWFMHISLQIGCIAG